MSVNYYVQPARPGFEKDYPEDPGVHLGQWANGRFLAAAHGGKVDSLVSLLDLAGSGSIVAEHGAPMSYQAFIEMVIVESNPRPPMVEADFWRDGIPFSRSKFF